MKLKEFKEILYSLFMAEEETNQENVPKYIIPACDATERAVADFLKKYNFNRTFPLDVVLLADKMGEYKIYYFSNSAEIQEKAEAAINTEDKDILLNNRFKNSKEAYFVGRYIICKIIAHYALNHIPRGSGWLEPKVKFREEGDIVLNKETANFAYELLLPKKDFLEQWKKLGEDVNKISLYFGASQRHVVERKNFLLGNNSGGN